jgi:hypothetical protein
MVAIEIHKTEKGSTDHRQANRSVIAVTPLCSSGKPLHSCWDLSLQGNAWEPRKLESLARVSQKICGQGRRLSWMRSKRHRSRRPNTEFFP